MRTGAILAHSASGETAEAPGRVDSPPTSIRSAPSRTSCSAWATAASGSRNRPPSENESGVTFTTPITRVRSPVVIGPWGPGIVRTPRATYARSARSTSSASSGSRNGWRRSFGRRWRYWPHVAISTTEVALALWSAIPRAWAESPPTGEDLLLEQGRRLQRYAVEPDGIDQPFSGHDPDPLGVAPGRLQLAGHLGERRPVEHAGGEPVTGRGRRHGNREPARDKKAPGGAKAAVAAPRTATRARFAPRMVRSEGSVSARPVVVSVDGPSAAGKSTVVARAAALFGWVPLAEAFDRIDPAPDLRFSSDRELEELERTLLEEDARRYRNALSLRATGLTVVTDTGFLGPLTYTAGLVALGRASPTVLRRIAARARELERRRAWGMPDVVVHLAASPSVRRARARSDRPGHPADLERRHAEVGRWEERFLRTSLPSAFAGRVVVVRAGRGADAVARSLRPAILRIRPLPARSRTGRDVLGLFAPAERADPERGDPSSATVKKATRPDRPPRA